MASFRRTTGTAGARQGQGRRPAPISPATTAGYASTWPWPRSAATAVTWWTRLQQLALRGHQQLYRHRSQLAAQGAEFRTRPTFRDWCGSSGASCWSPACCSLAACWALRLLVYLFPGPGLQHRQPQQVAEMQSMYDPEASRLGRAAERASSEDWMMFGYYIMHNIGIAFQTFASRFAVRPGQRVFPDIQRSDDRRDCRPPDAKSAMGRPSGHLSSAMVPSSSPPLPSPVPQACNWAGR